MCRLRCKEVMHDEVDEMEDEEDWHPAHFQSGQDSGSVIGQGFDDAHRVESARHTDQHSKPEKRIPGRGILQTVLPFQCTAHE